MNPSRRIENSHVDIRKPISTGLKGQKPVGFPGQFRQISSQFKHRVILLRDKLNAAQNHHSISFYEYRQ